MNFPTSSIKKYLLLIAFFKIKERYFKIPSTRGLSVPSSAPFTIGRSKISSFSTTLVMVRISNYMWKTQIRRKVNKTTTCDGSPYTSNIAIRLYLFGITTTRSLVQEQQKVRIAGRFQDFRYHPFYIVVNEVRMHLPELQRTTLHIHLEWIAQHTQQQDET